MKVTLKDKLADMLNKLYPDYEFNEDWIYRDRTSNSKNGGLCVWYAEGRKYISFLRYDSFYVYAHDTMKDCAKKGMIIADWEKPLDVVVANH